MIITVTHNRDSNNTMIRLKHDSIFNVDTHYLINNFTVKVAYGYVQVDTVLFDDCFATLFGVHVLDYNSIAPRHACTVI